MLLRIRFLEVVRVLIDEFMKGENVVKKDAGDKDDVINGFGSFGCLYWDG